MKFTKSKGIFSLRLDGGEKIVESLLGFCRNAKIRSGFFNAIGAVDRAQIAHYNVNTKRYSSKILNEPLEIISLSGNITYMNNEPYIHCHACFSDEKMRAYAGHLKEATISATCEIFIATTNAKITRKYDDATGLNLMQFKL